MNIYLNMLFGHYCDNISFWSWNVVLAMNDDAEKNTETRKNCPSKRGIPVLCTGPFSTEQFKHS